jgi:LysM domain-containing protein
LVLALLSVGYVITATTGSDDDNGDDNANRTTQPRPRGDGRQQRNRPQRTFYRVRLNDTLSLIAEQTGVPVERLEELNPDLDAQNLIVGQRIRLRE